MSRIYLVRHGQAGTREAYDSLSDRGRRQARLLGEYLAGEKIEFAAVRSGAMLRQQATAEEFSRGYAQAGPPLPRIAVDDCWNEFDLNAVYRDLAPQLSAHDPEFEREYAAMCEQARRQAGAQDALVHRQWLPCDSRLVETWIAGRFPFAGESWEDFVRRVVGCRERLGDAGGNVIVFTSAVPVAIWAGLSLDVCDQRVMRLAGALYNASCTIVSMKEGQVRLLAFNAIPHLRLPELRTLR